MDSSTPDSTSPLQDDNVSAPAVPDSQTPADEATKTDEAAAQAESNPQQVNPATEEDPAATSEAPVTADTPVAPPPVIPAPKVPGASLQELTADSTAQDIEAFAEDQTFREFTARTDLSNADLLQQMVERASALTLELNNHVESLRAARDAAAAQAAAQAAADAQAQAQAQAAADAAAAQAAADAAAAPAPQPVEPSPVAQETTDVAPAPAADSQPADAASQQPTSDAPAAPAADATPAATDTSVEPAADNAPAVNTVDISNPPTPAGTVTTATVTDLQPNTTYDVTINGNQVTATPSDPASTAPAVTGTVTVSSDTPISVTADAPPPVEPPAPAPEPTPPAPPPVVTPFIKPIPTIPQPIRIVNDSLSGIPEVDQLVIDVPQVNKAFFTRLLNYSQIMAPRRPVTPEDGARQQKSLYVTVTSLINKEETNFHELFTGLLKFIDRHSGDGDQIPGCFDDLHLFRFMDNVPLDGTDPTAFRYLMATLRNLANPQTRATALKSIDINKAFRYGVTDRGRQKLLNYFRL